MKSRGLHFLLFEISVRNACVVQRRLSEFMLYEKRIMQRFQLDFNVHSEDIANIMYPRVSQILIVLFNIVYENQIKIQEKSIFAKKYFVIGFLYRYIESARMSM